jgi:hypothetical protein
MEVGKGGSPVVGLAPGAIGEFGLRKPAMRAS